MELRQIKNLIKHLKKFPLEHLIPQEETDLVNELKYAVNISSFDGKPSQFINKEYVIYCRCGEKAEKVKSLFTCPTCDKSES